MPALFNHGRIVATPGAIELLQEYNESSTPYLFRHLTGDWGDIPEEDRGLNEEAIEMGYRIMSVYKIRDHRPPIWIITEADRSATTILLPEDY
jgi:hypothetical protein